MGHPVSRPAPGATGEGFGSPVLGVRECPEFEFWGAASGITGGPKRPPVPPNAVNPFWYPLSCNDLRQMLDFASVMNVGDSMASVGSLSRPLRFVVVHSADGIHACQ